MPRFLARKDAVMKQLSAYDIDLQQLGDEPIALHLVLDEQFFQALPDAEIHSGRLDATVRIAALGERFEADLSVKGTVTVPCDRCLQPMDLPVDEEEHLVFKLGEAYEELSDELVVIDQEDAVVHFDWYLYEMIALAVPMRCVHEDGGCDPAMEQYLSGEAVEEEPKTDPRWEKLKQLKDNNN